MLHKTQGAGGERRAAKNFGQAARFKQANQGVALPQPGMRDTRDKHQNSGEEYHVAPSS